MNRVRSCFGVAFFAALIWTGTALGQEPPPEPLRVSQLITNPDKYVDAEIIVQGHIEISDVWRFSEAVHNLYESKAIVGQIQKDWKVFTRGMKRVHSQADKLDDKAGDASQEMDELERKYCITVAPLRPFVQHGKYLTDRAVIVRGRLIKLNGMELISGCNSPSGLMLQVDEVLDPPAPRAKSKP